MNNYCRLFENTKKLKMNHQLKLAILITILLIYTGHSFAQSKFKAGVSMGIVNPLNEFRSTEMKSLNAGFSEMGVTLNFDGDYYITHRLSFSARFHFGLADINKSKTYEWLKDEMNNYFIADSLTSSNIGYWQWSAPLLGVKYNYPIIINKFYFETALFSGLNISPIPTQSIIFTDPTIKRTYFSDNKPGSDISIPIMIDGCFRIVLNENLQLKLLASYYKTNISYLHKNSFQDINNEIYDINEFEIKVPLNTIDFKLGLIYTL